jgi:hypothetical protein
VYIHQGRDNMRHWNCCRGLLGGAAILGLIFSWALIGCSNEDDDAEIGGLVSLAGVDGAALEGLVFDFPDATIFGFPGESATLRVGDNAATFTLTTSGGTVINGTIGDVAGAVVACRLRQNPGDVGAGEEPFDETYDTCEGRVVSNGDIAFGDSGDGTVSLSLGRAGDTAVTSDLEDVTLNLREDGTVTINENTTPI